MVRGPTKWGGALCEPPLGYYDLQQATDAHLWLVPSAFLGSCCNIQAIKTSYFFYLGHTPSGSTFSKHTARECECCQKWLSSLSLNSMETCGSEAWAILWDGARRVMFQIVPTRLVDRRCHIAHSLLYRVTRSVVVLWS